MNMTKDGIIEDISQDRILKYTAAGWLPVVEEAREEVIRLKPPVKAKNTAKILDEANANKGDE